VVDDNRDVAETLTWTVDGLAREVKMVHSGAAALDLVRQWRPDIILCDLGMPGMDGYETCRRLRQAPGLERTLIVAVSGYGSDGDRRKSEEAGFDRHLVKPVHRVTVEELIRMAARANPK
jgi:two-component system CheB/CheR fusion protein